MNHRLLRLLTSELAFCLPLFGVDHAVQGQEDIPDRIAVTSERLSATSDESGFSETDIDRATLDSSPTLRLDDALREQVPGFSLFRRSSSLVANPTSQGVSLRNIGPNGAGRTLVLLDGIPQNDPFGGWVYWSWLPKNAIDSVKIVEGGGAGIFGNAALGGTIELRSRRDALDGFSVEADGGSPSLYEDTVTGQKSVADGALTFFGRADRFSTDGYPVVRADQRGPVDINAFSEDELLTGSLSWTINPENVLTLRAGGFQEDRGNGTPRSNNHTEASDFSSTLDGELPGTRVDDDFVLYASCANSAAHLLRSTPAGGNTEPGPVHRPGSIRRWKRDGCIPAFRTAQFAGLAWTHAGSTVTARNIFTSSTPRLPKTGLRAATKCSRECSWKTLGDRPPARRSAHQAVWIIIRTTTAVGVRPNSPPAPRRLTTISPRRPVRSPMVDWAFRKRPGAIFCGCVRRPTRDSVCRRSMSSIGLTVSKTTSSKPNANPRPERLYGAEFGVESRPVKTVRLTLDGYYNELDHPVANVTLANGPSTVAPFGYIPAGGTGEERENLGRAVVYGSEAAATWNPAPAWQLSASYLYSHGVVASAPTAPADQGKRLAQAPDHQGVIGLRWTPWKPLRATMQTRLVGDQFEDDRNTLRLDPYATVDVMITVQITTHLQSWVSTENVFDTDYQTGKDASGLVSIGAPRLVHVGVRLSY